MLKDHWREDKKKISVKEDESNAKYCAEDALKKLSKKYGPVGAIFVEEMIKEVLSAPQNIRATINGKKPSKSQKWLGLPEWFNVWGGWIKSLAPMHHRTKHSHK